MLQGVNITGALDPDARLMLRVRDGDDESFRVLLKKHRSSVIHFVYRMVQDQAVAEELAQEVFLRVYRSRSTYEPTAKFTTWLFRIAAHLAINRLRDGRIDRVRACHRITNPFAKNRLLERAARNGLLSHDRKGVVERVILRQALSLQLDQEAEGGIRELREVRDAIALLPEKQRAAVLMHKYEGMEYVRIAEALGLSESAVKGLLFRAYETLRARLAHLAH